jgi:acetylglutamate kinase
MLEKIQKAKTLLDALPYIKKFSGKRFVIKYGGSAQIDENLKAKFAEDILLLYLVGIKPIIVHGGGKKINSYLDQLNIEPKFVDGLRVTDEKTMEIVEMVLRGNINSEITTLLNSHGAKAIGMSGKDANFINAVPKENGKWGHVGEITKVHTDVVNNLLDEKFIPVIAPIASSEDSKVGFNINADLAASKIAGALQCEKVIFLTDIRGVLDKEKNLISTLTKEKINKLKKDETISGGMIPKVDACLEAVEAGVKKAHIIDGRIEHSILLEVFTSEGIGTVIKN